MPESYSLMHIIIILYIQSVIDYASTLWDSSSDNSLKPLLRLHKRALKVVLKQTTLTETDYRMLGVLPLKARFAHNKGTIMHKIITGCTSERISKHSRHIMKLNTPIPRIDLFKSSLIYSGSCLWNSLPTTLRQLANIHVFKDRYNKYLMTK